MINVPDSKGQWEKGFDFDYPRRYKYLDSLSDAVFYYRDSLEFLRSNAELRQIARKHEDEKALLIADKLDFYRIATFPWMGVPSRYNVDSAGKSIIARAKKLDFPAIEGSIYYGLGIYYFDRVRRYTVAFENFLIAFDIFEKLTVTEFPEKGFYNFDYAMRCYQFGDYRSAITYASQANQFPYRNAITQVLNYNLLGMAYHKLGLEDSALYDFRKLQAVLPMLKEQAARSSWDYIQIWDGIVSGNIGNVWLEKQQYDSATRYLLRGIELTDKWKIWDNTAGFAINLASIYLKQGKSGPADTYLNLARQTTYAAGDEKNRYELHRLLATYYQQNGKIHLALRHSDSALLWKDSIGKKATINKKTQAELAFAENKHAQQETLMQHELTQQKIVRNSLLGMLFAGAVVTILFVNNRRQKQKHREAQLEHEKRLAHQELTLAQEKLAAFSKDIHEKNVMIEALEKMQTPESTLPIDQANLLEQLRQSVILTDESWENFRRNFETVYPGFIFNIKEKFPACTPAESRLIVLEKLLLSNKEMAAMLGVSVETIRSTRSRLKKKLGEHYTDLI